MNKYSLSICIPTYNRAKFLPDAINSILNQVDNFNKDKIGICISDNASEDNTEKVIEELQKKSPVDIIYHRNEKNMWADYNFIKVIQIAHWEYCWWLGSDDIIEKWGINAILKNIEKSKGVAWIMVNVLPRTFDLRNTIRKIPDIAYWKYTKTFEIRDMDTFVQFFDYLWYISWQIVRKDLFEETLKEEGENIKKWFNAYVHIYIITKIFLKNRRLLWIPTEYVWWRAGNDSFVEENPKGIIKRMYIDINWYRNISKELLWEKEVRVILSKISTVHIRAAILGIKFSKLDYITKLKTYWNVIKEYKLLPLFWLKTVPFILCPEIILRGIQYIWRKYFLIVKNNV